MDARELKDKAAQLFSKGKFAKAAEQYDAYLKLDPKDVQTRLRMGDAWVKAGDKKKAAQAYTWAAEGFAKEGFLPRAIAAGKLVLEIDPTQTSVQQMLADLYSRKSSASRPAVPKEAAPVPVSKKHAAIELPTEEAAAVPAVVAEKKAPIVEPPAPLPPMPDLDFSMPVAAPPVEAAADPEAVQGVAIEVDDGVHTGEIDVPIVTGENEDSAGEIDVPIVAAAEVAPAEPAPGASADKPADSYTLDDLAGDFQVVSSPEEAVALAEKPASGAKTYELELDEAPSVDVAPPAPVAAEPEPEAAEVVEPEEASAPEEMSLEAALAAASASVDAPAVPPKAPASSPPGLKPRGDSQIRAAVQRGLEPAKSAFEESLKQLVKFDPPPVAPLVPMAKAASSFTELEFDGDSLLHSVELAAAQGVSAGAAAPAAVEDANESHEEAPADQQGGMPKIPLFSDLPHEAFIALFEKCPLRRFDEGQLIFEQGSVGESFFVICAGRVRIFKNVEGVRKNLATLEEGTFFGEVALLSDAPRTASVEAGEEDTQLLEISATTLAELSKEHPTVATALKKFCRQRLLSNLMGTAKIFSPFTKNERRDLIQKFRAREVVPGDVILKAGIPSDGLYLVLSGEVEVLVEQKMVAALREGELFGEMSLLTRSPATATVKARRRTSLLRLPREDFDRLIMSHPQILEMVAELTDARNRQNAALNAKTNATEDMI